MSFIPQPNFATPPPNHHARIILSLSHPPNQDNDPQEGPANRHDQIPTFPFYGMASLQAPEEAGAVRWASINTHQPHTTISIAFAQELDDLQPLWLSRPPLRNGSLREVWMYVPAVSEDTREQVYLEIYVPVVVAEGEVLWDLVIGTDFLVRERTRLRMQEEWMAGLGWGVPRASLTCGNCEDAEVKLVMQTWHDGADGRNGGSSTGSGSQADDEAASFDMPFSELQGPGQWQEMHDRLRDIAEGDEKGGVEDVRAEDEESEVEDARAEGEPGAGLSREVWEVRFGPELFMDRDDWTDYSDDTRR